MLPEWIVVGALCKKLEYPPLSSVTPPPQVRALLLLDSAAITALNAAVVAGDLGLGGSPGLAASVAAGANTIVALCAATFAVLLGGFGWHAFKGAGAEQAGIEDAQRAAAAARFRSPEALAASVGGDSGGSSGWGDAVDVRPVAAGSALAGVAQQVTPPAQQLHAAAPSSATTRAPMPSRRLLEDDFDDALSAAAAVSRQGAAAAAVAPPLRAGPRASIAAGGFAAATTVRRPQQSSAGRLSPASG